MGPVPRSLYLQSPALDNDEHLPAYCKSPSPVYSPISRVCTAHEEKQLKNAHIMAIPILQARSNARAEMHEKVPARNQSEKYELLARTSTQHHTRLGAERSATAMTRQEVFRPAGYTSAAPWLQCSQSEQSFIWADGHPYPYPRAERRRATTGSSHVVVGPSCDSMKLLPNPYSRAGTLSHIDESVGEPWPTSSNPTSHPPAEHLSWRAPGRESVRQRQQRLRAHLGPQYDGDPLPTSTRPQVVLPDVAITESRLILGGVDVYADMHTRDVIAHPNRADSGANTYAKFCPSSSGTVARRPPPTDNAQIKERHIFSQRPIVNNDSLHLNSHPPQLYPAGHLVNGPSPLGLITTQPSPHPIPSASIKSKPPFVRRDTPAGGMLRDLRSGGVSNRNVKNIPFDVAGTREWSSDLCMFCDHNLGACLTAFVCPCIVYAKNKARLKHLNLTETPMKARPPRVLEDVDSNSDGDVGTRRDNWFSGWATRDCAIHTCLTVFCLSGWVVQISNRAAIRKRYDIDGDLMGDCAAALCCSSCELAQESREIALEEQSYYSF